MKKSKNIIDYINIFMIKINFIYLSYNIKLGKFFKYIF